MASLLVDKVMAIKEGAGAEDAALEEIKLVREISTRDFRSQLETDLKHAPAAFVNALEMLNPAIHSIGTLEVLHLIKDVDDLTPLFYGRSKQFLELCNTRQVQLMPERFTDVVLKFVAVHLKNGNSALSAVGPLLNAVNRFRKSPEHLSGVHHEFVRICLLAKCYHIATRILDDDIIYLPELNGAEGKVPEIKMEALLMYYYYGGMVYVGLHQLDRALQFFSVAITVPAECTSQIMLEAYKKYLLVCLLLYGHEIPFPAYTSSLTRQFKNQVQAYSEVVAAYKKGDVANFSGTVAKHTAVFVEDTNMGLVKQCTAKLTRRNIKRLTETFLTLSLGEIAKRVELPDAKAAEAALVGMIADHEIFATINQLTDTVSFHDDPEEFITFATTARLQQETTEAAELYEKVIELDTGFRTSKAYIKKTSVKSTGKDSDELGMGAGSADFESMMGSA